MVLGIEILIAAAVLLAVGLAAAGRIDGMARAVPDAPPGLPPGPVTPEGLREVQLPVVLRGYRMADVDEILERSALELLKAQADGQRAGVPDSPDASASLAETRPTPHALRTPSEETDFHE